MALAANSRFWQEKRLELLKELRPNLSRVAVLSNPTNPYCVIAVQHARAAAAARGELRHDLQESFCPRPCPRVQSSLQSRRERPRRFRADGPQPDPAGGRS